MHISKLSCKSNYLPLKIFLNRIKRDLYISTEETNNLHRMHLLCPGSSSKAILQDWFNSLVLTDNLK